jgi:hypothetical protein
MSIEKILQRIKMIENDDFTTTGETLNEAIKGSPADMQAIFGRRKGILPGLRRALGLRDRDSGTDNTIAGLARTDKNTRDVQAAADRLFDTDGATRINLKQVESLPKKDESTIYKIFDLMKQHKVLPLNDLNQNYGPKYGYKRSDSQNGQDDVLVLLKSQSIQIQYSDDKLTNLVSMVISNRNKKFDQNDINAFYNDINGNKSTYRVSSVTLQNDIITIKF